jgi:protein-tyrosine phosphatase
VAGFYNFRDLGGHIGVGGAVLRCGRVFRSDAPRSGSDDALAVVRRLGVTTLIDLRSGRERQQTRPLPSDLEPLVVCAPIVEEVDADDQVWGDPARTATLYFDILCRGSDVVGGILRLLEEASSLPVVLYCTAGKDRTGIVAAVLLAALGVDSTDIARDYAASTPGALRLLAHVRERNPEALVGNEALVSMFSANEESMLLFLDLVDVRMGGVASLLQALGVDVGRLQATLLSEPRPPDSRSRNRSAA